MVNEQISSALILEDDADWDVTIKSQLVEFARGTRFIQEPSGKNLRTAGSPYGDDWDLLWVGHCGTRNRETEDQRYYIIRDDPTAVPQHLWRYPRRQPNFTPLSLAGKHSRAVFTPVRGLCTFGYALSLRGARRLLYHQSIAGHAAASDRALQRACNDRFMGFNCIAPYPPLVGTHRAAGSTAKDSDREDTSNVRGGYREKGETGMIVFSARLNMERLMGPNNTVISQWPEKTMVEEMDHTAELPKGVGVWVSKDQYREFKRPN